MKLSPWTQLKLSLRNANQWLHSTPDRALEQAYNAALMIKAIEEEHFKGQKISAESVDYGETVIAYFNTELQKYLKIISMRLIQFNASRTLLSLSDLTSPSSKKTRTPYFPAPTTPPQTYDVQVIDTQNEPAIILEKLKFIDSVTAKYLSPDLNSPVSSIATASTSTSKALLDPKKNAKTQRQIEEIELENDLTGDFDSNSPSTRFLPRSLLGTLNRIRNELDPEAEQSMLKNFRRSKVKTIISIRFILLLILVPLLTQQMTKNFVIGPVVDALRPIENTPIFLNADMEEDAFIELKRFEEKLEFEHLIGFSPKLDDEEKEALLQQKAMDLAVEYQDQSSGAIKNIFADILSFIAFGMIITSNKRDVEVVKSFMDDIVYGLSDSAKAFIIILLTDMFVGFHSPHGWEVLLEGLARHVGLPESREFIFLFIATFPVILDAVFKYWIFRYLNRSSPSAVATYKNMNE